MTIALERYAPDYSPPIFDYEARRRVGSFVTNLDRPVYAILIPSPELAGAICSRASRTTGDLREILDRQFLQTGLNPKRENDPEITPEENEQRWQKQIELSVQLRRFIDFVHEVPLSQIFHNPAARQFYLTWFSQYGDDSIAQMGSTHFATAAISQVAIKEIEDRRVGIAPIEKSTRYVDYSQKINGRYLYYVDPTLEELGLTQQYQEAMDRLFACNAALQPLMREYYANKYPEIDAGVIRAKAFDALRGLLPCATLTQAAYHLNGQAAEYLITKLRRHPLGEVRWTAEAIKSELDQVIRGFMERLDKPANEALAQFYGDRRQRLDSFAGTAPAAPRDFSEPSVRLIAGREIGELENRVLAAMLYEADSCDWPKQRCLEAVATLGPQLKHEIVKDYLKGRQAKYFRVGRAFEFADIEFEIEMDIGAYRDLQRHRMQTQQRQLFTCDLGFYIPSEVIEAGLDGPYIEALEQARLVYTQITVHDRWLAQYAVPMAALVRFSQKQNLASFAWEVELRTQPDGHPHYRWVEQEKFRLLQEHFPVLLKAETTTVDDKTVLVPRYLFVDMTEYEFARRMEDQRSAQKLAQLMARNWAR